MRPYAAVLLLVPLQELSSVGSEGAASYVALEELLIHVREHMRPQRSRGLEAP